MGCSGSKHGRSDPYDRLPEEKDGSKPLNVIILGRHKVGKNSVGNAILGKRVFTFWSFFHKGCVEKQGNVNGRFTKVVHAPGWTGFDHTTSKYNKGEIKRSIIHEGLVAFVLVVSLDSQFTPKDWEAVQQHMELIGGSVWRHTVLLFTEHRSDNQRETEIERRPDLVCLLDKCDHRWFMFKKDKNLVTDLLKSLADVAIQYNGIQPKNSACSQNSQMYSQCSEERAEKKNGGLQQENIELQQQATTCIRRGTTQESHHELSSASENTSGQLRKVYNIREPSGPNSQQGQENIKLLERRRSMRMAIKMEKQNMVELCSFLIQLTKIKGPINKNLEVFKQQSALFVDEYRAELIEKATLVMPIADSLLAKKIIETEKYSEIQKAGTESERMRLIYTALNAEAKKTSFLELLVQKDPLLVQELAKKKLKELEASDADVH